MRSFLLLSLPVLIGLFIGCGSNEPASPLQTFKTYTKAVKQKDTESMKVLLSNDTIKMHEQEAKAQNVTVDDIVKRETLFSENQTSAEFRNEKTVDEKATVEMKDSTGIWNTVQFVKEEGVWKIDRKGFATNIQQQVEQKNNELDQIINQGRQP